MTDPAATVVLDAVVTVPTVSPTSVTAVHAAACVRPTTFGTATCGGPDDTTNATALPTTICVPAVGFWLTTDPAGTVVLDDVVTVPTVNPAFVIAVEAAACVRPTTFGTATCGGPDDTTNATALPTTICVPAVGFWLMTDPDGTVVLDAVVTVPTVNPAFVITVEAAACVRPTTFGTATCGGPDETTSATALPTVNPASVIAVDAAACVRPTTFGTATCGGPDDTTNATALPITICAPAVGFWLTTDPAGTVVLDDVVTVPTVSPASVIAVDAAACVRPTTFGTATCGGPDDTTSATALPITICVPAVGF